MVDPEIQKMLDKYWWFLPACFFVGLLVVFIERKIDEYNRKRRNRNKKF